LIHAEISFNFSTDPVEVVAVLLYDTRLGTTRSWIFLCVYIPPGKVIGCIDPLGKIFGFLFSGHPEASIVLTGDLNLPDIDWEDCVIKRSSGFKGAES
jgi:hypothetical protein